MKKRILLSTLAFGFGLASAAQSGWVDLFNGHDLAGWQQLNGPASFEAQSGMIVGTTVATTQNSFLVTAAGYSDFELQAEFKLDSVNSGIQFRSASNPAMQQGRVTGYQVDFDPTPRQWTGGVYEEGKRGWIYPLTYHPTGKSAYRKDAWNHCRIRCFKNRIQVWINGQPTADLVDDAAEKGFIGLQVHGVYRPEDVGKKIYWRNIRLREVTQADRMSDIFTANLIAARQSSAFRVQEDPLHKKVSVYRGNTLLTEYIYPDSLFKPVLHPLQTRSGHSVTRNYPLKKVAGERVDHPHQVGVFFAHESVNTVDFWNLSTAIPPPERGRYGRIIHTRTVCAQGLPERATLITTAVWKSYDQAQAILEEMTTHEFAISNGMLQYDRTTELRALQPVRFADRKDALFGIRMARSLELPNDSADPFVNTDQSISEARIDNTAATGNYLNQAGSRGETVWGKRSPWLALFGHLHRKNCTIVIFDHPGNLNYPTHWHARGYGLIAANPLGTAFFSEGKSTTNLHLRAGEHAVFRYRMLLSETTLPVKEIEKHFLRYCETRDEVKRQPKKTRVP